jgi:TonB family protein
VFGFSSNSAHLSFLSVELKRAQPAPSPAHAPPARKIPAPEKHQTLNAVPKISGEPVAILGSSLGIQVEYPRLSRLLGEQGSVVVEVAQDQNAPHVFSSSGFPRLDQAAVEATKKAKQSGMLAAEKQDPLRLRFVFQLTDANVKR